MRIFVLQAGCDYQVTGEGDFPAWQEALGDKSSATPRLYPQLLHFFIAGKGPARPEEYLVPGHVSGEVPDDVARWTKTQ
jgi:hypothetical protein